MIPTRRVIRSKFNIGGNYMYAIIETGGKQIKVAAGDKIFVEKLNAEAAPYKYVALAITAMNQNQVKW